MAVIAVLILHLHMLSPDEEKFFNYWSKNRISEKSLLSQISGGLWVGFGIGIAIIISYASGWYTRANMEANSKSTPIVLIISIFLIALFCGIFYKRHRWDLNENYFKSLQLKKDLKNSSVDMQQPEENNSQLEKK